MSRAGNGSGRGVGGAPRAGINASRILVRASNWVGDAVLSLPALRLLRKRYPSAHITVLARPWIADLYRRESFADRVILYDVARGWQGWRRRLELAGAVRRETFDTAVLLTNSFESALFVWMARIPRRTGYNRDGRGFLLTQAIHPPKKGEIPEPEPFYYVELLRRAGILEQTPEIGPISLDRSDAAAKAGEAGFLRRGIPLPVIGVSPGATNSRAKQWIPERFGEAAIRLARAQSAAVAVFGSPEERELCAQVFKAVESAGVTAVNLAGKTELAEFIELAAACRLYLTNDSGAMHIASALGVPTIAVYGPTNELATGPPGPRSAVVREPVECMRCMHRDCPIDHRCMTRVSANRVADAALELLK
jgi:heptosyltransferase II